MPQIEVTFDIDANGIVNVSATDKGTGKEQKISIQANGGLDDKDIERMIREAEENAEADKKKREIVDARNGADAMIARVEKTLEEDGDKIDATLKAEVEQAITDLKAVMDSEDAEVIRNNTNALAQASMKIGEIMYKEAQANAAKPDDDDIIDGTAEEVA